MCHCVCFHVPLCVPRPTPTAAPRAAGPGAWAGPGVIRPRPTALCACVHVFRSRWINGEQRLTTSAAGPWAAGGSCASTPTGGLESIEQQLLDGRDRLACPDAAGMGRGGLAGGVWQQEGCREGAVCDHMHAAAAGQGAGQHQRGEGLPCCASHGWDGQWMDLREGVGGGGAAAGDTHIESTLQQPAKGPASIHTMQACVPGPQGHAWNSRCTLASSSSRQDPVCCHARPRRWSICLRSCFCYDVTIILGSSMRPWHPPGCVPVVHLYLRAHLEQRWMRVTLAKACQHHHKCPCIRKQRLRATPPAPLTTGCEHRQ
jgi:hypothetical protein